MSGRSGKTCAGCNDKVVVKLSITCNAVACKKLYCNQCINFTSLNKETRDKWICPECRSVEKKGGDNTSTPVRSNPIVDSVTQKKKDTSCAPASVEGPAAEADSLTALTTEIQLLRQDVSCMKTKLDNAILAITRCENQLQQVTSKLNSCEERLEAAEEKAAEVLILKNKVFELEHQLNYQAQQSLRNEVEIAGVPENQNENPQHIVMVTAAKIGLGITETDIEYVSRAGRRREGTSSRPLVVRFTTRRTRDKFYKAARSRRLNTNDIDIDGPPAKIYFNERLTRENRALFRESRARASEANYKHCWTHGGTIYIRKQDGRGPGSQAIPIKTSDDLDRILGEDSVSDPEQPKETLAP
ncbi:uncharacterized protein LOC125232956 [Leguminivora glycinivorella]|uniref:uncharacterized protein LOC125232956 n=1 Tax=Leguminivora glycinivorella TaxID=1035111 RepID=UPI0020104767|nr:uncharacterized protein LOC125232956 [Leguminivora glycinivorella]